MGVFDAFRRGGLVTERARNAIRPPVMTWDGGLPIESVAMGLGYMTRWEAMSLPGVEKSHHVLTSWASQLRLTAYPITELDKAAQDATHIPEPAANQPAFLTDRSGDISPEMRLWRWADDLMFHGRHLWLVDRDRSGAIRHAWPVRTHNWEYEIDEITEQETVRVHEMVMPPSSYLLFKVPDWRGLLFHGWRTLAGARATEIAWVNRILSPAQVVNFEIQADSELTQGEVDDWIESWRKRRFDGGQAVGATPAELKMVVNPGATSDGAMFLNTRNVNRNDIASHVSLDGSIADGSGGQDSLTYQTAVGIRNGFYEFDSAFWLAVLLARLSMDDVTPQGVVVRPMYLPVQAPNIQAEAPQIDRQSTTNTTTTVEGP